MSAAGAGGICEGMVGAGRTAKYEELIGTVRKGDFRPGTGWGGTKIGWCWGGQTVQGGCRSIGRQAIRVRPETEKLLYQGYYSRTPAAVRRWAAERPHG